MTRLVPRGPAAIAARPATQAGMGGPVLPKQETRHDARIATGQGFGGGDEGVQQFRTGAAKK